MEHFLPKRGDPQGWQPLLNQVGEQHHVPLNPLLLTPWGTHWRDHLPDNWPTFQQVGVMGKLWPS